MPLKRIYKVINADLFIFFIFLILEQDFYINVCMCVNFSIHYVK